MSDAPKQVLHIHSKTWGMVAMELGQALVASAFIVAASGYLLQQINPTKPADGGTSLSAFHARLVRARRWQAQRRQRRRRRKRGKGRASPPSSSTTPSPSPAAAESSYVPSFLRGWFSSSAGAGEGVQKDDDVEGVVAPLQLSTYERILCSRVVFPDDIDVSFEDVGGLEEVKTAIYEAVTLPLDRPELFETQGKLLDPPKGILFYGPPGTGKTLMAKAVCRDACATFISVSSSTLLDKYVGESQKLLDALFSLAHKLAPSIIFIDEIDGLLSTRGGSDTHFFHKQLTAQFLALWDGLTSSSSRVLVLGATNRPESLDDAVLRRMPRTFKFGMPDERARTAILEVVLAEVNHELDIEVCAACTEGYSGSDLVECCKAAAMFPVRELIAAEKRKARQRELRQGADESAGDTDDDEECAVPRPVSMDDFRRGLEIVPPSGQTARVYSLQRLDREASLWRKAAAAAAGNDDDDDNDDLQVD